MALKNIKRYWKCLLSIFIAICILMYVKEAKAATGAINVSLGESHSAAVKEDGSLWMWGYNGTGLFFGIQTDMRGSSVPLKVLADVKNVSLGQDHSAVSKEDGSLWVWGANTDGQLGNGNATYSSVPIKILEDVIKVELGGTSSAAIKADGSLWMWGNNDTGQLGNGSKTDSMVPVKILEDVIDVSIGLGHSAAVKKDGSLWMWGDNSCGELGTGNTRAALIPEKVLDDVACVSLGYRHSAAIKKNGSLWMWGRNDAGQLGNGETAGSLLPVKIMDNVKLISMGSNHSAAIKGDGSLWMWGYNEHGQLGNGNWETSTVPIKILDDISIVDLGHNYSAAIKKDGSLWCWGKDEFGQLGCDQGGTTTEKSNVPMLAIAPTYTVAYDNNGGSGEISEQTKKYGINLYLRLIEPVRNGYTFLGWSESATATVAEYQPESIYIKEKDTILYAVWSSDNYTITYNANGGKNAPAGQTKKYGNSLKLTREVPIRVGYTFAGWAESSTATNVKYQPGASYVTDKDTTLYAVWKINTYTIAYDANGGSEAPTKQTKTYGIELKLSNISPIREGYRFLGWAESSTASRASYQSAETYMREENVVLYAVWEKEKLVAQKQTISVKTNITKEYKKNSKFKLGTAAKTRLTYKSTNKKVVTVSKKGVVTIKGYGTAKIKVTAAATEYYKKASKTVKISIVPGKITKLKVTSPQKGVLAISWKKNKQMDGYEIQFSSSKKFVVGKTKSGIAPITTTATAVQGLKSGRTYYVRIRGYRKVNGERVNGLWADVKKVKIK